jgi:hypothetical protein
MVGKRRPIVAVHEAGHAVIARKFGLEVEYVTALWKEPKVPSHSAAWLAGNLDVPAQIEAFEKDAIVALAGIAAQRRAYPASTADADADVINVVDDDDDDMLNARAAIYRIACLKLGKPVPKGAAKVTMDKAMQNQMREVFAGLKEKIAALIERHWLAIKRVARALETHDRIDDQATLDDLIARAERHAAR